MTTPRRAPRVGFVHPDLGIGGAERLIVDAALGLQNAGYDVRIFTSHHDPAHSFEETNDGTLSIGHYESPFPRSLFGRFHIVFANLSQLHLISKLLGGKTADDPLVCDVYIVDQLSTCIPLIRWGLRKHVVFYCHFPDKLLADGKVAPSDGVRKGSLLKRIYRLPADWLEEITTRQADVILANSKFTAGVFNTAFPSIKSTPRVVYPGINLEAYETRAVYDQASLGEIYDVLAYPTILSLNRFEGKKNLGLAIETFAEVRKTLAAEAPNKWERPLRLILGGGFDPRLADNVQTLTKLTELCAVLGLSVYIATATPFPSHLSHLQEKKPSHVASNVTFLLNFTTLQRTALLQSENTLALVYTPSNEHFGITPVEGMVCGVPVLACESGGPVESIIPFPSDESVDFASLDPKPTGFLAAPTTAAFSTALLRILRLSDVQRAELASAAKARAREHFGMDAMCTGLKGVLREAVAKGKVRGFFEIGEVSERQHNVVRALFALLFILGAVGVYYGYI